MDSWPNACFSRYHMHSGTARLALGCGLHQVVPVAHQSAAMVLSASTRVTLLSPPEDQIELAERVFTWWQIFIRDKYCTIVTGFATCLPTDDTVLMDRIETGFPREMEEYETVSTLKLFGFHKSLAWLLLLGAHREYRLHHVTPHVSICSR
jgi:hypothetical protein